MGISARAPTFAKAPSKISTFQAALAAVRAAGSGLILALHCGDSTTQGFGAGTASSDTDGAWDFSYPAKMAAAMALDAKFSDFTITYDAICASDFYTTAATYAVYNTHVAIAGGSNWAPLFGVNYTVGGGMWRLASPNTDVFAFTPLNAIDSVRVIYGAVASGGGVMSLSIDAGAAKPTTMNCNRGIGVFSQDYTDVFGTGLASTGTIKLARASGGSVFIIAIIAWDASKKCIVHINAGRGSSTTVDWTAAGNYRPALSIPVIAPALTIWNLGINDERPANSVSSATFNTNLDALAVATLTVGDCVLIRPFSINVSQASIAVQDTYHGVIDSVATAHNCLTLDAYTYYGVVATWTAAGFSHGDTIPHMNQAGYADEATFFTGRLSAAL